MDPDVSLTNLIICSYIISKPSERRMAMVCTGESASNLKIVGELSKAICPGHDFRKIDNRDEQLKGRAKTGRLYMQQSNSKIPTKDPHSSITYADVGNIVDQVLLSKFTEKRATFDIFESKVVVFWDIATCPIPREFEGDWKDIPSNFRTALNSEGYMGDIEIKVVGCHGLPSEVVESWSSKEVTFIPSPPTHSKKETATKRMILSATGWLYEHLRDNGDEPCSLLAITPDVNLRFVIYLAYKLGFGTLVARETMPHPSLYPDRCIKLVQLVDGVFESH